MTPLSPEESKKKALRIKVQKAFELLHLHKSYQQAEILRKMKWLDFELAPASFSNILKNKRAGMKTLQLASEGTLTIIEWELPYAFDEKKEAFVEVQKPTDWAPKTVPEYDENEQSPKKGIIFRLEGRLRIQDKVEFMQDAQHEVVEFGVRLRTYADYFISRSEHEFDRPMRALLKRKVNFKLYLLDPTCNETLLYFKDRGRVQPEEKASPEVIQGVLDKLKRLSKSLNNEGYPGQMQVHTYKHIPYNHFLIVDGMKPYGKMIVSHYIYGIRRANCPVMIIDKQHNYDLFKRYWDSYKMLTKDSKNLNFTPPL